MNSFFAQFPYLEAVLAICVLVGGFFGIKNGRQSSLTKFQEVTNKALKDRIDVLESQIEDLKKENIRQQHVIDTITSALRKRGMVITVDGDMVPVADKPNTHRKRITTHPTPLARGEKKEEEEA